MVESELPLPQVRAFYARVHRWVDVRTNEDELERMARDELASLSTSRIGTGKADEHD